LYLTERDAQHRPSFGVTLATVLLPVVLMMGKALVDIFADAGTRMRHALDFLGTPLIALIIAVVVAMFTLGRGAGMDSRTVSSTPEQALPPGSVLLLAWLVAVSIRIATGSATVATVTASGMLAPLVAHLSTGETSLLVLALMQTVISLTGLGFVMSLNVLI